MVSLESINDDNEEDLREKYSNHPLKPILNALYSFKQLNMETSDFSELSDVLRDVCVALRQVITDSSCNGVDLSKVMKEYYWTAKLKMVFNRCVTRKIDVVNKLMQSKVSDFFNKFVRSH